MNRLISKLDGINFAPVIGCYLAVIGVYVDQAPLIEYGLSGLICGALWYAARHLVAHLKQA